MPTQIENATAANGSSLKTLQLLRKRFRQFLRVMLAMAICLAVAASALAIWWLTSLNRLPDIGDPFDVAAFRAFSVPDDQNAFTFLRRADESLTPFPPGLAVPWSQADPKSREWVEANRQAIELFQQAADQADAANPDGDSLVTGQRMALLVLLEADRRQAIGDMAGAWDCYRAILRMATHIRRRGSLNQRVDLYVYWDGLSRQRLATWAADPRTSIPQLHDALEEVLKSEPKLDWDLFAMKAGYLAMMRSLEQPVATVVQQDVGWEYHFGVGDMQLSSDMAGYLDSGWRFLLREPERSRRVMQLLYANWLAHVEPLEPRKPAVRALFSLLTSTERWVHDQRDALRRRSRGTGRRPRATSDAGRKLAGRHQRRQAANHRGEQHSMALVTGSSSGPQGLPRPRPHACRGDLSPRTRHTPTFRGRPARDLSQELARQRLDRPGR